MCAESGTFVGPVITIPTILFSGFFVKLSKIHEALRWISYISYVRYSFEGAMVAVYGFNREQLHCKFANTTMEYKKECAAFIDPKEVLKHKEMHEDNFWSDAAALTLIFIGLRVIAFFVLKWKLSSLR